MNHLLLWFLSHSLLHYFISISLMHSLSSFFNYFLLTFCLLLHLLTLKEREGWKGEDSSSIIYITSIIFKLSTLSRQVTPWEEKKEQINHSMKRISIRSLKMLLVPRKIHFRSFQNYFSENVNMCPNDTY
jgi:hypothetical protein